MKLFLDNWAVVMEPFKAPYPAPETLLLKLTGTRSGGAWAGSFFYKTPALASADFKNRTATDIHGMEYHLGLADPRYMEFLRLHDPETIKRYGLDHNPVEVS